MPTTAETAAQQLYECAGAEMDKYILQLTAWQLTHPHTGAVVYYYTPDGNTRLLDNVIAAFGDYAGTDDAAAVMRHLRRPQPTPPYRPMRYLKVAPPARKAEQLMAAIRKTADSPILYPAVWVCGSDPLLALNEISNHRHTYVGASEAEIDACLAVMDLLAAAV